MNICTIIAKNYVAHARVLAESFREHHPGGTCYVLVIDDVERYIDPASEPFELVRPDQLDIDDYEHMAAIYDVLELSTAVKPWLLRYLLDEHDLVRVAYFDPDIRIYDRLEEIEELTREHGLVLIPHITSPLPRDGKRPSEADILISGTYNLGFVSLERGPTTERLLDWWAERLRTDCVVAPDVGYFVDQRWMDFVHGVAPDFYVLRDPSYNVAYWNLHGRNLTYEGGRYVVDGRPLSFFHFSGFDPDYRKRLSKHQSRIEIQRGSALARICNEYADELLAQGYRDAKNWPYSYGVLPNGVNLDSGMHRLYRKGETEGAPRQSIFTPEGADRFLAWLNEPAPVGGEHGVTRYLYEIYSGRPDLRQEFPNLDGPDAMRLIEWHRVHGQVKLPYPVHPSAAQDRDDLHDQADAPEGVNVAGYFRAELGVGETARQVVGALEKAKMPVATVGLSASASRQEHDYEAGKADPVFPVNLICVNADMLPAFADQAGPDFFVDRYSIGLWWWEVNEFPDRFSKAFDHVDEVWVGSHFVADAISAVSPIPVVKMTMPVSMPQIEEFGRRDLDLPENFLFLFVFDYHSVFERKNPLAVVEAFKRAFPEGSGVSLVLKSINSEHHAEEHERLLKATNDHKDVHVIDRYVTPAEKNAMFAACDSYVSLHRSEGFGNTLAEAMYLGKPVIATGYSGNMEFMTPHNSYPVAYKLRPVGEDAGPYPATGEWAEPDVAHAADLMRRVFENPREAAERGRRAAEDLRRNHSPEAAGRAMAERIRRVRSRAATGYDGSTRAHRLAGLDTKALTYRIATTPQPAASGSRLGRILEPARRVLLKLIWPFAMQQRAVNEQLLATIKEDDQNLRAVVNQIEARYAKDRTEMLNALNLNRERLGTQGARLDQLEGRLAHNGGRVTPDALREPATRTHHEAPESPGGEASQAGGFPRQAISRFVAPFTSQQEKINGQLFEAVRSLGEKLGGLVPRVEAADRLVSETHALPYVSGSPFELFEEPVAGRVLGFGRRSGDAKGTGTYDAFEDTFRGPEDFIRKRQRRYLDLLGDREPVLDVGCGRGEFLDLLRERGLEYGGIDQDPDMVERCRAKGHERVEVADANSFLEKCADDSLGAIFCAQVIEHMPYEDLLRFYELGLQKLGPGGIFVLETVNPHSVPALKTFWVDLTHRHPIFPEVALALCEITGFESAYVFHPNGTGEIEVDRYETGEYAVVATKALEDS
jgi:glycosyltransferase involved in cell wall biosynthesis/SAM-dependent methyltransferase